MPLLAVQEAGAVVGTKRGVITVSVGDKLAHSVPLHDIDEVHLIGPVELTASARKLLLRQNVDVVFFDGSGRYEGRLLCAESRLAERRLAQYQCLSGDGALGLAQAVVIGKLLNQRTLLRRLGREREDERIVAGISAFRVAIQRVPDESDLNVLRGLEGYCATLYFKGFAAGLVNSSIEFTERNRRPPRDPINACLSFGYTSLLTRVETAVRKAGLDPYMGALHEVGRGKPALVLDLMEEFRVVVDRLVLRLFNRGQLGLQDFEEPGIDLESYVDEEDEESASDPRPPVFLARTGRAIFLRELADVWRTRYLLPESNTRHTLGDIIEKQAYKAARYFESGEPYEPWALK